MAPSHVEAGREGTTACASSPTLDVCTQVWAADSGIHLISAGVHFVVVGAVGFVAYMVALFLSSCGVLYLSIRENDWLRNCLQKRKVFVLG